MVGRKSSGAFGMSVPKKPVQFVRLLFFTELQDRRDKGCKKVG